jgi:hypothetical protein
MLNWHNKDERVEALAMQSFRKYLLIFGLTVSALTLFAVATLTQSRPQYLSQHLSGDRPMTHSSQLQSNSQLSSRSLSNHSQITHQITQLYAEELSFEAQVEFASSVATNSNQYTESVNSNNGTLNLTLLPEGNAVRYLLQVSSIPRSPCESDLTRACQQEAASARGDIAEIQIVLQGAELKPGTYPFGKGSSSPINEIMINSRQLYSDPSHGKLGCQDWGAGALTIDRAAYDAEGKLERFDAELFRVCDRTAPFPPVVPEDNLPLVEVENIEQYTYRASWRCHLQIVEEAR